MLFTICYTFSNGSNHISRFTNTDTDLTLFISDYNNSTETHFFSSFYNFSYTFNSYNAF